MIQVILSPTTPEEFVRLMKLLEQYYVDEPVASTGEPVEVKVEASVEPKKAKAPKAAPATTDSSPSSESQPAAAPSETSAAAKDSAADIPLETVRAKLADLSKAGKAAQVKQILSGYGVNKLTDLPKDKYAELMANVEQL